MGEGKGKTLYLIGSKSSGKTNEWLAVTSSLDTAREVLATNIAATYIQEVYIPKDSKVVQRLGAYT